jgi:2-hydroxychromene-2-carboxylate isomerase
MSAPTAQFLFDFGSPNAYLCHRVLPALEARTGAKVEYMPILLGGLFRLANNRSPMEAFRDIPTKRAYDRHDMARFVARHGLSRFRMNPHFPVNTLRIMRGALAAQRMGCFEPYVEAVFAAMWEQERNMDDVPTIVEVLERAGVDAAALLERSQDPEVKAALLANTEAAHARGAFGSPTFFVGGEMWFGKERLCDVEAEIRRIWSA